MRLVISPHAAIRSDQRMPRSLQWLRLVRRSWLGRGSARPPIPLRGYVWDPTRGQRFRAGALRPTLRCAGRHGSP